MKRKLSKEDKREIANVAIGACAGAIIAAVIIGIAIGGMALYSFLKY